MRQRIAKIFVLLMVVCWGRGYCAQVRIVSLAPATTEILFALGLGEEIVGNTVFCNYPEEAQRVYKVGTFSEPSIERIIALKPDIIFAAGLEQSPAVTQLQELGLKVIVSDPENLSELMESIEEIGRVTGKAPEAKKLVKQMREETASLREIVGLIPEEKRLKVFLEIWFDPIMTAGKGAFVDELLSIAGGINIAYDAPRAYSRFSAETVVKRNPDVIILGYMGQPHAQDSVAGRLGWQGIQAVKNKRIICDINPDLILRPGPRVVEGMRSIYNSLYGYKGAS